MTHIWNGCCLLELFARIMRGEREFDGLHAIKSKSSFQRVANTLYPDPYHNYFCKHSKKGVMLCLHPDVLCIAEKYAETNKDLMSHLWFGHQKDPVDCLSAAMAAKIFQHASGEASDVSDGELSDDEDDGDDICASISRQTKQMIAPLDTVSKRQRGLSAIATELVASDVITANERDALIASSLKRDHGATEEGSRKRAKI